jgi:hypothetical protein
MIQAAKDLWNRALTAMANARHDWPRIIFPGRAWRQRIDFSLTGRTSVLNHDSIYKSTMFSDSVIHGYFSWRRLI